jgi:hypothetical protein
MQQVPEQDEISMDFDHNNNGEANFSETQA